MTLRWLIHLLQLKSQVERLTSTNRELRRKHKTFQNQVRTLCDERADFLVQLQDQQRDINGLRQRLGLAQKENEDLVKVQLKLLKCVQVLMLTFVVGSASAQQQSHIRFRRSQSATFHHTRAERYPEGTQRT